MAPAQVIFLSVPGLRPRDITPSSTPTLHQWANRGELRELTPTFPCVTSCVQASMFTGTPPREHGVIANGFYDRARQDVQFWVGRKDRIIGPQIWDALKERGLSSAAWHAQNIKDAAADFIVTPEPIHEADGTTKLWCYSKPDGLYAQLVSELGHFPLQHYWGPLANIESTKWILRAAAWLHLRHSPNFHWIYVPHLDYAMQKFGPNSAQSTSALGELDGALAEFAESLGWGRASEITVVVSGEYAMTDVVGAIHPNRLLRQVALLSVRTEGGHEYLDLAECGAFAMVDHQFAHVYVKNDADRLRRVGQVVDLFRKLPGIAGVYADADRAKIGMDHSRSGDLILVAEDDHWLTYYWWLDDALAPPFARTVDIHRKPGYDPVELFFDPKTRSIPLDATLVKGSHGVPATQPDQQAAWICSRAVSQFGGGQVLRDTDVKSICFKLLDAG